MQRSALALAILISVGVGLIGGYTWGVKQNASLLAAVKNSLAPIQETDVRFKLVKPLLAYRTPEATTFGEYLTLDKSLESDIAMAAKDPSVLRTGVYFRDLNNARWVGVNFSDTYHPASLLKVPLMIAVYKQAEADPSILSNTLTYHAFTNLPTFEAPSKLVVGETYTVNDLVRHMIVDSDNGATFLLLEHINPDILHSVYSALGIIAPGDGTSDYQISTRTYGLFFRILYNATFLSPAYSERALELLSEATFSTGLVGGIPTDIPIAHKYGEHVIAEGSTPLSVELSDCGIVYYPAHPYLLCVMVGAKDEAGAAKVISTISKTTYDAIAREYPATTTPAR